MKRIIAGYTAAPADAAAAAAADYYATLVAIAEADGLEFAWSGPDTPAQLGPVVSRMPAAWTITLNDIPATFRASVPQPTFGLASPDDAGRAAALAMLREMNSAIRAMNDKAGRRLVLAAEIHCAPGFDKRVVHPNADALARSLDAAAALDWDGCAVLLEHCDAYAEGRKPAKGFLNLADEIAVLRRLAGAPIGLSLNWGRSLIEVRDPARVIDHVVAASQAGVLRAFTFSGTAGVDNAYGEAWADSHLPFDRTHEGDYGEPASLMSVERANEVLPYLQDCLFIAVKTQWPAKRNDPRERAASVATNFHTLHRALQRGARAFSGAPPSIVRTEQ
jgi:hypothetical protein